MSIRLAVDGRPTFEVSEENITLGSDPHCTIAVGQSPEIQPKHAVIRKIAGRWLIEAREGEAVFVGGPEPRRLHWLNPGDVIRLSPNGLDIVFQPQAGAWTAETSSHSAPAPMAVAPQTHLSDPVVSFFPDTKAAPARPVRPPDLPKNLGSDDWIKVPAEAFDEDFLPPPLSDESIPAHKPAPPPPPHASHPASPRPGEHVPAPKSSGVHQVPVASHSGADGEQTDNRQLLQRGSVLGAGSADGEESEQDSELKWVIKVIGYSFAAGLIFVLIWLAIAGLMSAFAPVQMPA